MLTTLPFFYCFYITMAWAKWIPKVHKIYHNLWRYLRTYGLMGILMLRFSKKAFLPTTFHIIQCDCGLLPKAIKSPFLTAVLPHPLLSTRSGSHKDAVHVASVWWLNKSTNYTLLCPSRPHNHQISINRSDKKISFICSPYLHQIICSVKLPLSYSPELKQLSREHTLTSHIQKQIPWVF